MSVGITVCYCQVTTGNEVLAQVSAVSRIEENKFENKIENWKYNWRKKKKNKLKIKLEIRLKMKLKKE